MAIANRVDPEAATRRLPSCLRARLPLEGNFDIVVSDVQVSRSSGMSTEIVFFRATVDGQERRYAARVAPAAGGLYPSYDLERELRIMRALARNTDLPVPKPLFVEPDPSVLGGPFMLMPHVSGNGLADDPPFTVAGWLLEQTPTLRACVHDEALGALAKVHGVDWRSLGLEDLAPTGGDPLGALLDRDERWYAWASGGTASPVVEAALEWLRRRRPSIDAEPVLNWGDARLSNMLFADSGSVCAVLDWEMACIAPPARDLGWWLFAMRHHTEGIGAPLPDGFPKPDALVARYEELSGRKLENVSYYEVLGGLEANLIMLRVGALMIDAGMLPPDSTIGTVNPASLLLADLIGVPRPEGDPLSFIGNRG